VRMGGFEPECVGLEGVALSRLSKLSLCSVGWLNICSGRIQLLFDLMAEPRICKRHTLFFGCSVGAATLNTTEASDSYGWSMDSFSASLSGR